MLPFERSAKRVDQGFRVIASDRLRDSTLEAILSECRTTEKLDGTCVLVRHWKGRPWLWARHDRKPTKFADKRFRKFQNDCAQTGDWNQGKSFSWNILEDFREVPEEWIPASGSVTENGDIIPDAGGHIPGWVPVKAKSHCWHSSTICEESNLALVLCPSKQMPNKLEIILQPLEELDNCTLELVGTNINANPYRLGSKRWPVHLLVRHGILELSEVSCPTKGCLRDWFSDHPEGQVEGIVWHCPSGTMYKLHRHHLDLKWPIDNPRLLSFSVVVNFSQLNEFRKPLFKAFSKISGQQFESLDKIQFSD